MGTALCATVFISSQLLELADAPVESTMASLSPLPSLVLTGRGGRRRVFCDWQSSNPCFKHHSHILGLLSCSGIKPVTWKGNTSLVLALEWGKEQDKPMGEAASPFSASEDPANGRLLG